MDAANDPAAWQNFYVMIGTANAAITGLLFVALSMHLREILDHPVMRPRAIVVLVVLTLQIVIAAVVLTPQPSSLMGAEILAINVAFLVIDFRQRVRARINAQALLTITIRVVYVYAAVSLLLGVGGGFYVLAAVLLVTLVRSIGNCWTLLTALDAASAPSGR